MDDSYIQKFWSAVQVLVGGRFLVAIDENTVRVGKIVGEEFVTKFEHAMFGWDPELAESALRNAIDKLMPARAHLLKRFRVASDSAEASWAALYKLLGLPSATALVGSIKLRRNSLFLSYESSNGFITVGPEQCGDAGSAEFARVCERAYEAATNALALEKPN